MTEISEPKTNSDEALLPLIIAFWRGLGGMMIVTLAIGIICAILVHHLMYGNEAPKVETRPSAGITQSAVVVGG